jgi:hypothetical protein
MGRNFMVRIAMSRLFKTIAVVSCLAAAFAAQAVPVSTIGVESIAVHKPVAFTALGLGLAALLLAIRKRLKPMHG